MTDLDSDENSSGVSLLNTAHPGSEGVAEPEGSPTEMDEKSLNPISLEKIEIDFPHVAISIGQWAEETALSFLALMDIENVNDRRAALAGMKEHDIARLIVITQGFIDLQSEYAAEHSSESVAMVAAKNSDILKAMKSWLGI